MGINMTNKKTASELLRLLYFPDVALHSEQTEECPAMFEMQHYVQHGFPEDVIAHVRDGGCRYCARVAAEHVRMRHPERAALAEVLMVFAETEPFQDHVKL